MKVCIPGSVCSSLAVVRGDVEAVFTFHLVIQSGAFRQHDLSISAVTIKQNDFERQLRSPFVHRISAYLVYSNRFENLYSPE